jgi:hypothetical protein
VGVSRGPRATFVTEPEAALRMSAYRTKAERCTSARQVEPTAEVTPAVACSSAVDLDGAGSSQSLHVSRLVSRTSRGYRGRRYRETMPAAGTADIAVTPWPQSANRSCSVLAILPRPDVQSLPTVAPISASQRLSRRCAQTQTVACLAGGDRVSFGNPQRSWSTPPLLHQQEIREAKMPAKRKQQDHTCGQCWTVLESSG